MDKLVAIFEMQRDFLEKYGLSLNDKDVHLALIVEVVEALAETPWKTWKKHQKPVDRDKYIMELADIMHFFVEAALLHDIDADELFAAFCLKNNINRDRQERGY